MLLGQAEHNAILRNHIEPLGSRVEPGSTLVSLKQDDEGVTVEIEKIVDGKTVTEHAKFAYVIGADGGHSTCFVVTYPSEFSCPYRLRAEDPRYQLCWGDSRRREDVHCRLYHRGCRG